MTLFRSFLFVCLAACVLAQTPPSQPAAPNASSGKPMTPVPSSVKPVPPPNIPVVTMQQPPAVPPDRVVLRVGTATFTAAQFDEIIDALPQQMQMAARGPARKQFADQLVRMLILADDAKRRKLDESPVFKTQEKFTNNNLLANLAFKELGKETKVSEDDARKYYEAHKTDYEQVTARHILIRTKGAPLAVKPGQKELSDEEALAKAQDLRKKILAGADFAKLAETESDDSTNAATGGSLGSFGHGQMAPSFDQAAFALKPGDISEPVKTQYGYHLIKVESHGSKAFEDVKTEIEQRLLPQQTQQALEDMVKKVAPLYDPEFFSLAKQ